MVRPKVPNTVPSLGAAAYRKLAARKLPAPVMFCGTIVGLPGMYLLMWRASSRP
jgi:hypothetical protein